MPPSNLAYTRRVNTLLALLLAVGVAFGTSGCEDDVDPLAGIITYDEPEWNTITTTPRTGTPQDQIDRFVEANGIDTTVTSSGLIYNIENPGNSFKPSLDSTVTVFYRGYFVDGQIFDQTADVRGSEFNLNNVIPAWTEGLPLLGEDGRMWMIVRPKLGYGELGRPTLGILGSTVLVFEIVVLEVGLP